MTLKILVDGCAFDELHRFGVDLDKEKNGEGYELVVSALVVRELERIPDSQKRQLLLSYAQKLRCGDRDYFGFRGGFGSSNFIPEKINDFLVSTSSSIGAQRPGKDAKNIVDRHQLGLSIDSAVLTAENKIGRGLGSKAVALGATIINIKSFNPDSESFSSFILRHIS
ncbi:MAG: hypothetical protein K0M54_09110 [Pseudomonas sp.]|uniref:hypothetical protein n=1 Tax=Pseudomonas sp. TaxID=306 RepID=UPI0025EDDFDA|nr:hypothetical protein [Pseudomonas sp.]MBW8353981.1 hypothetical protein [Pseudomonas sp.]